MGEIKKSLEDQIEIIAEKFLETIKDQEIFVVSHFDTDGISSATIMVQALRRLDARFSLRIVKSLEPEFIKTIPKDKIILFLDLASGSFDYIAKANLKEVFVIDHHEISKQVPESINIINPELHNKQKISASSLVYLFCKKINKKNAEFAKLAILGMVGDMLEKDIDKLNSNILDDGEIKRKRGLLIYPSTRPLNRTLEHSSHPFIPGVTGDPEGVLEILREINITPKNKKYKSIIELNKEEMEKLITAIMLRNPKCKHSEILGDIFLIKLFNKLEDAREISAMVNACSRAGETSTAIQFLMESQKAKKSAEATHIKHKQNLISGLKFIAEIKKTQGKGFIIINAKDKIKDTIIGTIASILSNSSLYEEDTVVTAMAYYEDKIKVSIRIVGRNGRNVREILSKVIDQIGGEVGGHKFAAGCIITRDKEEAFIQLLKKNLEIEMVKV